MEETASLSASVVMNGDLRREAVFFSPTFTGLGQAIKLIVSGLV